MIVGSKHKEKIANVTSIQMLNQLKEINKKECEKC